MLLWAIETLMLLPFTSSMLMPYVYFIQLERSFKCFQFQWQRHCCTQRAKDCQTKMKKGHAGNGNKFPFFTGKDRKLYIIIVKELSFIISSGSF